VRTKTRELAALANLHYSFGDTQIARQRLDLLSSVFDLSSRAFLHAKVLKRPHLALDIGCGPGNTTRLIGGAPDLPDCGSL
jgi:hypothetical protein